MKRFLRLVISFCLLLSLGFLLNSNTNIENQIEGKWTLDVRRTYWYFTDSLNRYAKTMEENSNPIQLAADFFNTITSEQQIKNADLKIDLSFFNGSCAVKFKNIKRPDQLTEYHFFGNQFSIGPSRYNILLLDAENLIIIPKTHEGHTDYPLFFKRTSL
jgi:hypothetical protein